MISIHTPHAGSDSSLFREKRSYLYFNPHSPCGERLKPRESSGFLLAFQSTLPMRGATDVQEAIKQAITISIHTPHAGSDQEAECSLRRKVSFQSTLPMRGATTKEQMERYGAMISIHTPHAGSDELIFICIDIIQNFNPHSPCGERLCTLQSGEYKLVFQSTLPMRGATMAKVRGE